MITIATCHDLIEAQRIKWVLEAAAIPAFIPDEMTASAAPHFLMASGVRVQVAQEHAAQAWKVLDEERQRPSGTDADD